MPSARGERDRSRKIASRMTSSDQSLRSSICLGVDQAAHLGVVSIGNRSTVSFLLISVPPHDASPGWVLDQVPF